MFRILLVSVFSLFSISFLNAQIINTSSSQFISYATSATPPPSPGNISGELCVIDGGTTLSVSGGGLNGNNIYQWGVGLVPGANQISSGAWNWHQYVNPNIQTTYWVRIYNTTSALASTASFATVTIKSTPPSHIQYVSDVCANTNVTLTALGGKSGTNGEFQWGTMPIGSNIIVGAKTASIVVTPSVSTTYWARRVDASPCASVTQPVTLTVTVVGGNVVAPTSIKSSSPLPLCGTSGTTLTAIGGGNGTYQWGTGEIIGQNILNQFTYNGIYLQPNVTTTYWVRIKNSNCGTYTAGVKIKVLVGTIAGQLTTSDSTICPNTTPGNIVLSGNVGSVIKWQSSTNSNFSNPVNISNTTNTLTGIAMGVATTTKYYRALVQNSGCNQVYTQPIAVNVAPAVTFSGFWNDQSPDKSALTVNSNLTLDADLTVCSCRVIGNAKLTIPDGITLTVIGAVDVNPSAELVVNNNGSLVQVSNEAANFGKIKVYRKSTPMKLFDFTYWSAPVTDVSLLQLSPNTLSDKYFSYEPLLTNNWKIEAPNTLMTPSKGYIVRAPQGWSLTNETNGVFTGIFTGKPNNGTIPVDINKGVGKLNLIGNPYPSAVDIDLFLSNPTNAALLKGTIYLWTHNTAIAPVAGAVGSQYSAADYAKYNLTGSVKTSTAALSGENLRPTGKIASGQAFFIEAKDALAPGSYQALFNNSMRVAQNNDQFFKNSATSDKHRLWLNITNANGAFNEMLLGYVPGATNELDAAYDGKTFAAGNAVNLYTVLDNEQLSIQGRALPFTASEVIPVGYSVGTAGTFSIALDNVEGVFTSQNVYLFDKQNNTTHDLKIGAYSFITAAGSFNDRFEIRFITNSLSTTNFDANDFKIAVQHNVISINSGLTPMSDIAVYDLRGRLLFSSKVATTQFSMPTLNMNHEVLVVSITFENGTSESRKVIVN